VERRADLWAAFLKETDPNPQTPVHEGLRDYFGRINQANARFRQDGAIGWLTDRGRVFVALGSPDQIIEPNIADLSRRNRTQVWEYRQHRFSVVFVDTSGFDRWEMSLTAEAEFEALARRLMVQ
jgi:GWxTD domain-containing protein